MTREPTKNFLRMAEVYKTFSAEYVGTKDYSDEALVAMYLFESFGEDTVNKITNAFFIGKQWMDLTLKMWVEDIEQGYLFKFELYKDPKYPSWFLDRVIGDIQQGRPS